ncbi:MAG: hypothetical protein OIF40_08820, partial [Mangrovicoccus sp.]|nr:hypothetical protein [Mangrovicoccus sp.]
MLHIKAADRFSTFSSTGFAQLALGVAASAIASGYGRGAYGGTCAPIATPGSYLCAGPADPVGDVPQLITPPANGADIIITSSADFGLDRSAARYNAGIVVQDMSGGRDIAVSASHITGDYFSGPAIEITQENGAGQRVELETSQGAITYGGGLAVQSAGDIAITTGDVISEFSDAISVTGKPTPNTAPYTAIGTLRIETTAGRLDGYSSGSVDDQAAGIWVYSDYAKDISITTGDVAASSNAIWVLTEKQG